MLNQDSIVILLIAIMMMSTNSCSGTEPKTGEAVRPMAVAGQFYSADRNELLRDVSKAYQAAGKDCLMPAPQATPSVVQAVIVPHAGYVFSAEVAASAFQQIPENAAYDHIFLLGPSHHVAMKGASVCNAFDAYATPLGKVEVDRELCDSLIDLHTVFSYEEAAHTKEHCLEVQLPLLQYRLKEMPKIVPIIIGTQDFHVLRKIAQGLKPYFTGNNLFVISSDFSHYPSYEDANRVDKHTGDAVATGSLTAFVKAIVDNSTSQVRNLATSACGQCAIAVLMMLSEDDSAIKIHHTMYRNSGDSPYGGKREVVGYHGFVVTRETHPARPAATPQDGYALTEGEKQQLLTWARQTIQSHFTHEKVTLDKTQLPPALKERCGAFVTLSEKGRLRGCIGRFGAAQPLYEVVEEMASAAAFEDPRFQPVREDEMKDIVIEISVLTPLKRIQSIDEFQYGKQGIYMRKGYHSGTFLPQVAQEVNWTKEEFLGHCAQDKAGLGWDGWRGAELYTYEAIVFHE